MSTKQIRMCTQNFSCKTTSCYEHNTNRSNYVLTLATEHFVMTRIMTIIVIIFKILLRFMKLLSRSLEKLQNCLHFSKTFLQLTFQNVFILLCAFNLFMHELLRLQRNVPQMTGSFVMMRIATKLPA